MGESQLHYSDSHFIPKATLFESHPHTLFPSDKEWKGDSRSLLPQSAVLCPLGPSRARLYQGWAGRANENSRYYPFVNPVSCVLCIGTSRQAEKVSLSELR